MNRTQAKPQRTQRRRAPRRGVAIVEMAVLCPLILLLALATTDFGRVIAAYSIVSNAARAAEYGATNGFTTYSQGSWESQIQQTVTNEMQALPFYQAGSLQVTITTATDSAGVSQVTVDVSYPFNTIVTWVGVPSAVTLNHSVEMRRRQ